MKLTNKQQLYISAAWLSAPAKQPSNGSFRVFHKSNEYVDVHVSGSNKSIRCYSPQLVSWLASGWKKDWKH